jgi:hypothetical protein
MIEFGSAARRGSIDKSKLSFIIEWDGIDVDVRFVLDTSVTVPEKDAAVDVVNVYETTLNFEIHGYSITPNSEAQEVPIIKSVTTNVAAPLSGQIQIINGLPVIETTQNPIASGLPNNIKWGNR